MGLGIARIVPAGGRNGRGYLPRALNANPLGAAAFTRNQQDPAGRHPEVPCQEADEVAIGLAIDGRCGQPDLQTIAMGTTQRIARGPGLDMNGKQQVLSLPLVPRRSQCPLRYPAVMSAPCRQPQSGSLIPYAPMSGWISILMTCRPMRANNGDRSMPATGGMIRWIGPSTGLVMLCSSAPTGV